MVNIVKTRILITGGAGFIGSNLCEVLLQQENQVTCLDNFATGKKENIVDFLSNPNFKLIEGDIRNLADCKKAVENKDYVLHQAALGSVSRSIDDPITTNEVNINGFLNMLVASKEAKIKRFIYACSSSTYGDHPGLPKTEGIIGNPLSPYAVTKYVNELYARVFSDLYGIETIGLRYFNVFGPKQDPNGPYAAAIPKFIHSFLEGKAPVIFGDGTQSRDFTYIGNVIKANQLAISTQDKSTLNTIYNVAYGESTDLNHLLTLIKEILSQNGTNVDKIQPIYEKARLGDIKQSLASIDKIKQKLGYRPEVNLKQGLAQTIKWHLKKL